jgi:hypothetical protein
MPKEIPDFFDDAASWVLAALAMCGCKQCKNGIAKPCLINPAAFEKSSGAIYFEATCSLCNKRQHYTWSELWSWID